MPRIARVAQISDLHFVEQLTELGRTQWTKAFGTKSHDYNKLEELSQKFTEFRMQGRSPEFLVITGDVTTDGSAGAMNTAKLFVEQDIVKGAGTRKEIKLDQKLINGLNIPYRRRIVVPGNHDRYAGGLRPVQRPSFELENAFRTPKEYPYVVGYTPPITTQYAELPETPRSLLFFVFDSTLTQKGRADYWNLIARGRVEAEDCQKLKDLVAQIRRTNQVATIDGQTITVDYDTCVRVALLHHHPISTDLPISLSDRLGLTLMEDSELLVDACFDARIDVVCFGHQHVTYSAVIERSIPVASTEGGRQNTATSNKHKVHFFCCPSTSEYSEKSNGFYLFDFHTDFFTVESFRWNGSNQWLGHTFESKSRVRYSYSENKSQPAWPKRDVGLP
jgi:3',5'-cyclic AMP phosphodiesterase CpdA